MINDNNKNGHSLCSFVWPQLIFVHYKTQCQSAVDAAVQIIFSLCVVKLQLIYGGKNVFYTVFFIMLSMKLQIIMLLLLNIARGSHENSTKIHIIFQLLHNITIVLSASLWMYIFTFHVISTDYAHQAKNELCSHNSFHKTRFLFHFLKPWYSC